MLLKVPRKRIAAICVSEEDPARDRDQGARDRRRWREFIAAAVSVARVVWLLHSLSDASDRAGAVAGSGICAPSRTDHVLITGRKDLEKEVRGE